MVRASEARHHLRREQGRQRAALSAPCLALDDEQPVAQSLAEHALLQAVLGVIGGVVEEEAPEMAAGAGDTATVTLGTVSVNTGDGSLPVGARLEVAGETTPIPHVVTAVTKGGTTETPTYACTISPALGAGTYTATAAVTVKCQQLEIKVGDGDLKYTQSYPYKYDKDRGHLDNVRHGDNEPMDVSMNFTFEHIRSGTSEPPTPVEAIKQEGAASNWVTYSSDPCQPYSVGVLSRTSRPASRRKTRNFLFPDYRVEKIEPDFKNANIAINGKCNVTEPIITRGP